KAKEAAAPLREIAREAKETANHRNAAIDALAVLADADSVAALRELSATGQPMAVRFHAAAALGRVDLEAGAGAAAAGVASAADADDFTTMVQAFLVRKGGSDRLAAALAKEKVSPDAAKRV